MKKILFLILFVGATAPLLANLKQQTFADQEKTSPQNQHLLDISNVKCDQINSPSFNYQTIGGSIALVLPLFDIGIGHRKKYNDFAMDTSLRLSTLVLFSKLEGELKFLKYFNNIYVGGGLSAGVAFVTVIPFALQASPVITVGKENKKNLDNIRDTSRSYKNGASNKIIKMRLQV